VCWERELSDKHWRGHGRDREPEADEKAAANEHADVLRRGLKHNAYERDDIADSERPACFQSVCAILTGYERRTSGGQTGRLDTVPMASQRSRRWTG
jgi:hypothetical protein